jgi:sulfate transport system permease protein
MNWLGLRLWYQRKVLPGFGLTLGITLSYLSLIVLIPLSATFLKASNLGWAGFLDVVTRPEVVAAFQLSFSISFFAGLVNLVFGTLLAWVLVRYEFPGRKLIDAMVDLPFALPTAVAGISLTAIYAPNGWLGRPILAATGLHIAYSQLGILIALIFIGIPFVVRTVQPVLADLDLEFEEAAASLGASRKQTIRRVVLPVILPAAITGFALAFARALGEYGSVIFISSNKPMHDQIVPLLIMSQLDQFHYGQATAIAVVMLVISFALMLLINGLQRWAQFGQTS